MNQKCTRRGCEEEARFLCGTLKNPKILCGKHYALHIKIKEKKRSKHNEL